MKDKDARQAINDLQLAVNVLIEMVVENKKDNAQFLDMVRYDPKDGRMVNRHRHGRFFE